MRGDEAGCRAQVARAAGLAKPAELAVIDACGEHVLGFLELTLGHLDLAIWQLNRSAGRLRQLHVDDPILVRYEADLVEVLVARGQRAQATWTALSLGLRAERFDSDWARAAARRCRGMLAGPATFEREFHAALAIGDGLDCFDRARTQLLFGERLRRARRRVDARAQLSAAHATFERLGATPWAARAARELEATTMNARTRRDPSVIDDLTPQERTVVQLLVEGATIREAALRLFLSPKTVEAHLGRAYRKLGVRNRAQLVTRFSLA